MVIEVLVILASWVGLGTMISLAFGIPFYFAVPLAIVLLVLYDFVSDSEVTQTK